MESLTDNKNETEPRSRPATIDRVTLGKTESEKLAQWLKQVEETSNGFLTLSKSDLVNFLIRDHKIDLQPKELSQLRGHHYDPIRHINWITQELKVALAQSDLAKVAVLQNEIKGIELSGSANVKVTVDGVADSTSVPADLVKPKRKRAKKIVDENPPQSPHRTDLQSNLPEG